MQWDPVITQCLLTRLHRLCINDLILSANLIFERLNREYCDGMISQRFPSLCPGLCPIRLFLFNANS